MILAVEIEAAHLSTKHRAEQQVRGGKRWGRRDKGYTAWLLIVRAALARARPRGWPLGGARYSVRIWVHEADRRSRDLDNIVKPLLDAANGVLWRDDRQVDHLEVVRCPPDRERPRIGLLVRTVDAEWLSDVAAAVRTEIDTH